MTAGTTAVQVWTLIVAGLAVVATVIAAFLLRRTGKGTVAASEIAAAASERSAQAAEKSAQAAQDSVGLNSETAAGIARRAEADALARRYEAAAEQLGHDKAAVRLAGVHAMARLADDWTEQRQTCIDVLLAYLRMPFVQLDGKDEAGDVVVRRAILSIVGSRLHPDTPVSWSSNRFDFSQSRLPAFNWGHVRFNSKPSFASCTFYDQSAIGRLELLQGADMFDITVASARLRLSRVLVRSGFLNLNLSNIRVNAYLEVHFDHIAEAANTAAGITQLEVSGDLAVYVAPAASRQGALNMHMNTVTQGGRAWIRMEPNNLSDSWADDVGWPQVSCESWAMAQDSWLKIDQQLIDHQVVTWRNPTTVQPLATLDFHPRLSRHQS